MHPNQWLTETEWNDRPLVDTAYQVYGLDYDKKHIFPLTEAGLSKAKELAASLSTKDRWMGINIESSNGRGRTGLRGIMVYHNGKRYTG